MTRFDAQPVLDGLKEFQRRTVDHVFNQFYRRNSRHFLVADETGLGKSVVARGLIARAIEHLQDDDAINQIDVVYVCSNADLARQNLKRLNVTGHEQHHMASRLTMLALHAPRPGARQFTAMGKPVNLIAFTPGTTFETGQQMGMAQERAVILGLLKRILDFDARDFHACARLLQGATSSLEGFRRNTVDWIDRALDERGVDESILGPFGRELRHTGLLAKLEGFLAVARDLLPEPAAQDTTVAPEPAAQDTTAAPEPAAHDTPVAPDPAAHDTTGAPGPAAHETTVVPEPAARGWSKGQEIDLPPEVESQLRGFIGELRTALANASLSALQPDLVILDEFQKFPHLLRTDNPAGQLANALFSQPDARVLLLSATPYKPFALAEESEDTHERDLFETLGFLAAGNPGADVERVRALLRRYRADVHTGTHDAGIQAELRDELLKLMCRNERPLARSVVVAPSEQDQQAVAGSLSLPPASEQDPQAAAGSLSLSRARNEHRDRSKGPQPNPGSLNLSRANTGSLSLSHARNEHRDRSKGQQPLPTRITEIHKPAADITAADLSGYVALMGLAEAAATGRDRALVTPNYWKSAPYFTTFCDGYKLRDRIRERHELPEVASALQQAQHIKAGELRAFRRIDPGNARMRALEADTVGAGWWRLLWVPPALPYLEPRGPYRNASMTKRLVFSSWMATPTAVASLLSHEAERRLAEGAGVRENSPEQRRATTRPMAVSMREGEPADMPTLAAMWPSPALAAIGDPLRFIRDEGAHPANPRALKRHVVQELTKVLGRTDDPAPADTMWRAFFSSDMAWPTDERAVRRELLEGFRRLTSTSSQPSEDEPKGVDGSAIAHHIKVAESLHRQDPVTPDRRALDVLADLAISSPGSIAWRVIDRLCTDVEVPLGDKLQAAATLSNGIRSLFNRPEASLMLQSVLGSRKRRRPEQRRAQDSAWRRVVIYSAMGNLEAVLDEWLFHKATDSPDSMDGDKLLGVARAAAGALSLAMVNYQGLDADAPAKGIRFPARFALRYNNKRGDATGGEARLSEVREAFNSPFWPFVLASTSVGQEGIDFHWWCHAVFHWNIPSNPVDFEQREGRVDRFRGHAIRRNIAAAHGDAALTADGHPWESLYELAADARSQYGHFAPDWVYPGDHRVERHVSHYSLSTDEQRFLRLKQDLALYRLTFGQPRQEDMLELLRQRFDDVDPAALDHMRLDLSPPK